MGYELTMGRIRTLVKDDLPAIVGLHQKLFRGSDKIAARDLESYLHDIFFNHPWADDALESLAYEHDGRLIGCMGVMPRRMVFNRQPILAAISHNFMVEPECRTTLAGVHLLQRFFGGPQELSLAEGNRLSRRVWQGLGGATSWFYSLRWTRPLRPVGYVLHRLRNRSGLGLLAAAAQPCCRLADAVLRRMALSPFHRASAHTLGDDLDNETLIKQLPAFAGDRPLRPDYDDRSLTWLWEILRRRQGHGVLRKHVVRNTQQTIIGWYVYYLKPDGVSEVLQVTARPDSAVDVLDHLFDDAEARGALAVSGQLDPALMEPLSDRQCFFHHGGSWLLMHARRPELLRAMDRGDAFFTRLDGEWWIGLHGGQLSTTDMP